ncbi:MAG: hypothetical protein ABJH72_24615 [Reichenbachiella sp.]|uniref:hypothetical protein n=1 Tax=Reichenbachiella sp. TaxID=2184521 RepID=UPI00326481AA
MKNHKFHTAVKNGSYISVNSFKPGVGLRCGCNCPVCGEAVVSNVTAKKKKDLNRIFTNHFSHKNENSNCTGGQGETDIHLYAKELLKKSNYFRVPRSNGRSINFEYIKAIAEPAFPVEKHKQKRPDLLLFDKNDNKTAIEIVVTNPVPEDKMQLYKDSMLNCLDIDLSSFYGQDLENVHSEIEHEILKGIELKKWIYNDEPSIVKKSNEDYKWIAVVIGGLLIFRKDIRSALLHILKVFRNTYRRRN